MYDKYKNLVRSTYYFNLLNPLFLFKKEQINNSIKISNKVIFYITRFFIDIIELLIPLNITIILFYVLNITKSIDATIFIAVLLFFIYAKFHWKSFSTKNRYWISLIWLLPITYLLSNSMTITTIILFLFWLLLQYTISLTLFKQVKDTEINQVSNKKTKNMVGNVSNDYYKYAFLLFNREQMFYKNLLIATEKMNVDIFIKVGLKDLLGTLSNNKSSFNKISQKHIDFVICDRDDQEIILAIEFDEEHHTNEEQQQSDKVKNDICKIAGLPLLRFNLKQSIIPHTIKKQMLPHIQNSRRNKDLCKKLFKEHKTPKDIAEITKLNIKKVEEYFLNWLNRENYNIHKEFIDKMLPSKNDQTAIIELLKLDKNKNKIYDHFNRKYSYFLIRLILNLYLNKYILCPDCANPVTESNQKYCLRNIDIYLGLVYCFDCQKKFKRCG